MTYIVFFNINKKHMWNELRTSCVGKPHVSREL